MRRDDKITDIEGNPGRDHLTGDDKPETLAPRAR
jgi:hypothetical protein